MQAIFTSCEGDYHLGVAALLNSAVGSGFEGEFHVYYKGSIPSWTAQLESDGEHAFRIANVRLFFHETSTTRHFGFDKPFQALSLLDDRSNCDTVFYFDADIVILSPWAFFGEWAARGVGIVLDCNFPLIPARHPWRCAWRSLASQADQDCTSTRNEPFYGNSGFFCVTRDRRGFLEAWKDVTIQYERAGGDTTSFHLDQRWSAVTGDQDLLAAALEQWHGAVSFIGPEGMGFNGHYWLMSHATERPKPWARNCLVEALKGHAQKQTVGLYLANANTAVQSLSKLALALKRLDYMAARIVSSVYRRPSH